MSFLIYFKDLFTALILRPLLGDPFRSVITILGVAIGVAVFLSIRLTNAQTMLSFQESVDLVLGKSDAVIHADGLSFDTLFNGGLAAGEPGAWDDALVYSDDERIERMFDALHAQASDLQILVFSCRNRTLRQLGGHALKFEPVSHHPGKST